jgi:hypothetical protein
MLMKGLEMKSSMHKTLFSFLLISAGSASGASFGSSAASSNGGAAGVGVAFFGVTGLSVYADVTPRNFLQAAVGFSKGGSYAVTADYAFPHHNALSSLPSLTPYWGFGGVLLHDESDYWSNYDRKKNRHSEYFGARVPLGLNWVIPSTPIQLAAEIAPSLLFSPSSYGYLQGGFSARILF